VLIPKHEPCWVDHEQAAVGNALLNLAERKDMKTTPIAEAKEVVFMTTVVSVRDGR
jgi:hypothetical protein